jgi:hypothetical protein
MVETRRSPKLGGEALNFGRIVGGKWVTDFGHPIPYRWHSAWAGGRLVSELVPAERRRHGRQLARGLAVRLTIAEFYGDGRPIGRGETMKAVMISVMGLLLVLVLLSYPAWAQQGYPARTDCDAIVRELQMRLPGFSDPSRVNYDWGNYVGFCNFAPWNVMISADDVNEMAKVLHPNLYK